VRRPFKNGEEAQALVEFAILGLVLIFIFSGVVDFSRFMYYSSAISSSSRVAAELAGNPCETSFICGRVSTTEAISDDFILQAAHCEATPYLNVKPAVDCSTCVQSFCASGDPCPVTCSPCSFDVCIARNPTGTPVSGQDVTVWVGYNFVPFTPIMNKFFPNQQCWKTGDGAPSTDGTAHTVCTKAVGRVF
jgi:TadE-like protein